MRDYSDWVKEDAPCKAEMDTTLTPVFRNVAFSCIKDGCLSTAWPQKSRQPRHPHLRGHFQTEEEAVVEIIVEMVV